MRDSNERIDELLVANNALLERARKAENALILTKAEAEGATSLLLDVQRECIEQRNRADADELVDKIEGLKCDLDAALDIIDRRGDAGAREWLRMNYPRRESATELFVCAFRVGDRVEKVGGDYTFAGIVRAVFAKGSGAVRLVVEDDRGVLHVYSEKNLRAAPEIKYAEASFGRTAQTVDFAKEVASGRRVLKHGEYQPGDRVRYVARCAFSSQSWNRRVGSVSRTQTHGGLYYVRFDDDPKCEKSCHPGNLEHEDMPHFEVGDRVRAKNDVGCVRKGEEGEITKYIGGRIPFMWRLDRGIVVGISPPYIELVRAVQAGGAR